MFNVVKKMSLAAMLGMALFGLSEARGQPNNPFLGPGIDPFFQMGPGLSLQQAAFNVSTMGQAYSFFPNQAFGRPGLFSQPTLSTGSSPYGGNQVSTPYYPYPYYSQDPYSGSLHGSADVITSMGRGLVLREKANLVKEQVQREKIENRRRMFDQWLYEREHTPTFEEERQRLMQREIQRSLNNPPANEILSAKALNDVLADLQKLQPGDYRGLNLTIDEDVLKHINVSSPRAGGGNVGLLKNEGRLLWPIVLRGEEFKEDREEMDDRIAEAYRKVRHGKVDKGTLDAMSTSADKMRKNLTSMIKDLRPEQYMEAKRYLANLDDAIQLMSSADAMLYFSTWAPQGKTIEDLVKHMTSKGLVFSPAVAGDEAAYMALHRALVSYDGGMRTIVAQRPTKETEK